MPNTHENSPAADRRHGGDDERARPQTPAAGNVLAFRPKPARDPNSHPPPPPTAA